MINLTRADLEAKFSSSKGLGNFATLVRLPLVKFIVNFNHNHAINSTNYLYHFQIYLLSKEKMHLHKTLKFP